jgi:two-component system, NarL family, nitrate/nitrite response regulator NarL
MHADWFGSSPDSSPSARVLVSGDHPLISTALGLVIAGGGFTILDPCSNQPEALRRAAGSADVIVMDLDLDAGRLTRMEKLEQLLIAVNGRPVLIVTRSDDPAAVVAALRNGAAGVVLKSRPADVLLRAIRAVLAGGAWVERTTVAGVFPPAVHDDALVSGKLTRRELQIVELVSQGLQNKKIAERLSITHTTVRHHLTSIFEKLAITNRMELMRYAFGETRSSSEVVGRA